MHHNPGSEAPDTHAGRITAARQTTASGRDMVSVPLPRLYLNQVAAQDWLIALEFGRVDDGQPAENWSGVSEDFGFLRDGPDGRIVGFKVLNHSSFDPEDPAVAEIWSAAQFEVPLLGLARASAGEIIPAARALIGDEDTINRVYFDAAVAEQGGDPREELDLRLSCLQAGDCMAHFALGYTLYELGRHQEAYRHLRYYTEIAPAGPWNWCWLGKAAQAIGELGEARAAYVRAIELGEQSGEQTDAAELLAALDAS